MLFKAIWRKTYALNKTMMNDEENTHATCSHSLGCLSSGLYAHCRNLFWNPDLGTGTRCSTKHFSAEPLVRDSHLVYIWYSGCPVFNPALSSFYSYNFIQTLRCVDGNQRRHIRD